MLPLAVEIDDLGLGFITLSVDFVLGLYEDVVDIVVDGEVLVVEAVDMVLLVDDEDGAEICLGLHVAVEGLVLAVLDDEGLEVVVLVDVEEVVLVVVVGEAAFEEVEDVIPVEFFAALADNLG